jgi:hypothetical protein
VLLEVKESGRGEIEAADFLLEWRHWQRGFTEKSIYKILFEMKDTGNR